MHFEQFSFIRDVRSKNQKIFGKFFQKLKNHRLFQKFLLRKKFLSLVPTSAKYQYFVEIGGVRISKFFKNSNCLHSNFWENFRKKSQKRPKNRYFRAQIAISPIFEIWYWRAQMSFNAVLILVLIVLIGHWLAEIGHIWGCFFFTVSCRVNNKLL